MGSLLVGALLWACGGTPAPTALHSDGLRSERTVATPSASADPSGGTPGASVAASDPAASTAAPPGSTPTPTPSATAPAPGVTPTPPLQPTPPQPTPPPQRPASTAAARPLPECRYAGRPTRHTDQSDWRITLLDPIFRLPADYVPERLVSTSRAGLQAGYEVRPEVIDDLRAMAEASRDADAEIAVRWAYRSYGEQAGAFAYWTRQAGYERALRISARPGHSEHQLGTAIDFRSADSLKPPWEYEDWGRTPAGAWMHQNSWRYGFVLSYPRGMSDETCYDYEPWHFRYVGRELAAAVHESGKTLRRYLWERFETSARHE